MMFNVHDTLSILNFIFRFFDKYMLKILYLRILNLLIVLVIIHGHGKRIVIILNESDPISKSIFIL